MVEATTMRTVLSGPRPWLIGVALLMAAGAFVWTAGSAVVIDETGGVETAVVTNGGGADQKLHQLLKGYFYAMPQLEGTIEVRCSNGLRKQAGYVTGSVHTTVRVLGKTPCERLVETN